MRCIGWLVVGDIKFNIIYQFNIISVPGFNGKTMPDWGISLIAIGALLSGIWGGRSPFMAQMGRQLLSLLVIIVGYMARRQQQNNQFTDGHLNDNFGLNELNEQNGSQLIIDNLQSALLSPNDTNGNDSNNNDNKHQTRRPSSISYQHDISINSSKKNSTTQTEDV